MWYNRSLVKISFIVLLIFIFFQGIAQPKEELIKINIAPDHEDWTYKIGESVRFNVSVLKYGNPLKDVKVRYELMKEKMEPFKTETMTLNRSEMMIKGGTLDSVGFLRCKVYITVDGKEYQNMATAAFEPEKISPTVKEAKDFDDFWKKAIDENKKIPLDTKMTLISERCTEKVNVYEVSFQNYQMGSRIYGILCIPKKSGRYPAVLEVPGAGVRPYYGRVDLAEEGVISLQIGIHGIPVTMDQQIYDDLRYGALQGYWVANLDNKDQYYYKRVYLGCLKAVDLIAGLPEYDGQNLAVTGESQGGALTIVTAALDKRVKCLAAIHPALSDLTGFLHNRAGGWPHIFYYETDETCKEEKIKTIGYYDVVNFAKRLTQKGWYSWGFNDEVCPPTSIYSAYNQINSDKELHLFQDTGHWVYPEGREMKKQWLLKQLKKK